MQKITIGTVLLFFSFCSFGQTKLNQTLKKELDSIYNEDQKWRDILTSGLLQSKGDSIAETLKITKKELVPYVIKLIPKVDSLNLIRIEQIIKQYGYPGLSLVGQETNEAAYYVIQHSEKIDKYLPIIKKASDKKELSFKLYAMMLDRSLMYKGKEQIYGTQIKGFKVKNIETGKEEFKMEVWPIKNPKVVDSLRKKVGFKMTVSEYAKANGVEYRELTIAEINKMQEK